MSGYYYTDKGCKFFSAEYNPVECDNQLCKKCGWNPEVAKERLEKIRTELNRKYRGVGDA